MIRRSYRRVISINTKLQFHFYHRYDHEEFQLRNGDYSLTDCRILYSMIREKKPRTILDFAPAEGRTTSCIINGLLKNCQEDSTYGEINYFAYEKIEPYLMDIKHYLYSFVPKIEQAKNKIKFHFGDDILNDIDFLKTTVQKVGGIHFLFIDAAHDSIMAKWYIKNLFPLLKENSVIHIHDIYYNCYGNGWKDVHRPQWWELIVDPNVHKRIYPTLFDNPEYKMDYPEDPSNCRYEADEIRDFYYRNQHLDFYSTFLIDGTPPPPNVPKLPPKPYIVRLIMKKFPKTRRQIDTRKELGSCSMYFFVDDPQELDLKL